VRVDSFLFNSELDLLELRLQVLDSAMDRFVIVESPVEFSGRAKPLYFADNRERFAAWKDKIVHYVVTDTPNSDQNRWPREYHQRSAIIRALQSFKSSDLIFMSDVDEIPDPAVVRRNQHGGYRQVYSMYYVNAVCTQEDWVGTIAMFHFQFQQLGMQKARDDRYHLQNIRPGGWHFAYVMPVEQMHEKLKAFAHGEYDNPQIHGILEQRVKDLRDLFGAHSQPLKVLDIATGYFPQYLKDNVAKYAAMTIQESVK
jgi:beta-1,4-mannosyl-glycoprotein beta-1,4-N-acetylglucosaminyltransferase